MWMDAFEVGSGTALTRVEETDPAVRCDPCPWVSSPLAGHSKGKAIRAQAGRTWAFFRFLGTGVTWRGTRDAGSGRARVYVDRSLRGEVDAYAPVAENQAHMFTAAGLDWGTHDLAIEVTGERNPASSGAWVTVDAIDIVP